MGDDTGYWDQRRECIESRKGKWIGGKDVLVGPFSMMQDLLGKISYMQMVVLNVTGRLIDTKLAKWLEGNFIGMSYPDSRIWCNQIGALCGTMKTSVTAATTAGVLSADSRAYGGSKSSLIAVRFIQLALQQYKGGSSIEEVINQCEFKAEKPVIMGFARPIARQDERIEAYQRMTNSLGFEVGEHLRLAYQISQFLKTQYGLSINSGGYSSAFLTDQGFSAEEIYQIKCLVVASGVTAAYLDNFDQPENSFLPWRCNDINYEGPNIRDLPVGENN